MLSNAHSKQSKKLEKRSKVISTLIFGLLVNFCIFMTLHCFFSVLILQEGKNIISTFETMYGSALDLLDDVLCRAVKVLIVKWPLCNIWWLFGVCLVSSFSKRHLRWLVRKVCRVYIGKNDTQHLLIGAHLLFTLQTIPVPTVWKRDRI